MDTPTETILSDQTTPKAAASACCAPSEASTCCAAEAKGECCGAAHDGGREAPLPGSCGCR
jgi:hypothetical protein